MKPIIYAGLIARNEARDIPRTIASIRDVVDGIVLIDTGSTDDTIGVAMQAAGNRTFLFETYTEASVQDDAGNWRITDFARARNRYIDVIEKTPATWLLWLDADEELVTPQSIRRAVYYPGRDCFSVWMEDRGTRWQRQCLWKARIGIRFAGAVHEYPVLGQARTFTLDECTIRHDATPHVSQEDSNVRNLRILTAEYKSNPTARGAFYLANTHKDAGRNADAVYWYKERIMLGADHRDEWLFAILYCARQQRAIKDIAGAEATCMLGITAAPDWAEFHVEHAFCAYNDGRYELAIERAKAAPRPAQIPLTHLFREPTMYRDQPLRLISWCYEHLGDMQQALEYAEQAKREIIGDDIDWDKRIARLRAAIPNDAPAYAKHQIDGIALCRPGAIGDILMTLNLIPALRQANPGKLVYYFCDAWLGAMDALGSTMRAAGVDVIMDSAQWPAWRSKFVRAVDLVGYPLAAGYPEVPMKWHLLQYFATEMGLTVAGLPSLEIRRPARDFNDVVGPYATYQEKAGWSSYKEWPRARWDKLIAILISEGIWLRPIDESLGRTLSQSIALVANATLHIGGDSFCNHLTNYNWRDAAGIVRKVPGVILWGSTQVSASGYAHNTNISKGPACQPCFRETVSYSLHPRGPCIDVAPSGVHRCMDAITVDEVVEAVRAKWQEVTA